MIQCPWCKRAYAVAYELIVHARVEHKEMIAIHKAYHCVFCGEEVHGMSTGAYQPHVPNCVGYAAAILSGCSMRGEHGT